MAITFNSGYDNSPHKKANPIERGTVYSGTAMSFDGTNDYINIGNVHNFSTGNFSISCRVEQTADSRGTVIAKGTYNGVGDWLIYDASTSDGTSEKLFFRSDDNDGDDSVDLTSGSIAGSGWHHLVVTRSGTTLKGYDNGVLIDTATFESNYDFTNTHDLNIGARADGSQRFWSGSISNVQIWNTVLTLAQIQEMYKQPELILPTGITSSSLRGHWLLNEGSGVTAYDSHIPSGEKKFGETSIVFDGTGDYLELADNNDFDFQGTEDFTMEAWVYMSSKISGENPILLKSQGDANVNYYLFIAGDENKLKLSWYNGSSWTEVASSAGTWNTDTWYHIAAVRNGSDISIYRDGVSLATNSSNPSLPEADGSTLQIGMPYDQTGTWNGYIDDIRITKGLAVYTGAFTAPTAALTTTWSASTGIAANDDASKVVLLIHGDNSKNRPAGGIVDSSTPSSIKFDQSNDRVNLTTPAGDLSFTDFTVEFWYRPSDNTHAHQGIIGEQSNGYWIAIEYSHDGDKKFGVWMGGTAGSWNILNDENTGNAISDHDWHHYALVRSGTTGYWFQDGTQTDTWTLATTALHHSANVHLGESMIDGTDRMLGGYLQNVRVSNTARYTSSFTPDRNTKHTADANTKILIHGDSFTDSSSNGYAVVSDGAVLNRPHAITVSGDAKLSDYRSPGTVTGATWDTGNNEVYQTGLVKGRGTMNFDGTNDYVNLMAESVITGTGNFTVSCWASWGGSSTRQIWNQRASGDPNPSTGLLVNQATGNIRFETYTSDYQQYINSTSTNLNSNALNHIVCVRDGTTSIKLYVNGVLEGSHSAGSAVTLTAVPFDIGRNTSGSNYFPGFVDEFAMWDEALSQSEITTLYNNAIPYAATNIQSSNLKGYWRNDGVAVWSDRSTRTSFGTSAIYFDGNDDLEFAHNSGIEFGADPFTIEMNIRLDSGFANEPFMSVHGGTMADRMFNWERYGSNFSFYAYTSDNTGGVSFIDAAWTPNANQWYHIAVVRNGADVRFYIDGTQFGSTYNIGSASMADGGYPLKIGTSTNTSNSEYAHFTGYMDGIRISKGVARYTTRFTKPSEPFVSDANTSFLLNGSVLTDESSNSISITNSGDTSIVSNLDTTFANDGTVSGSPSIRFLPEGTTAGKDTLSFPLQDTTADVLSLHDPAYFEIPQNADFAFGAKDFTVEFWINIKELETGVLIGNTWEVHTRKGWSLYWNKSDTSLYLSWSNTTSSGWDGDYGKSWTPDLNTWIHFHLVRSGDTFTFYENNSVITSSFTDSDSLPTELTKPFRIGADPESTAADFFNASFDEVRVYHKALSSAERIQNYNHGAVAHGKTVIEE